MGEGETGRIGETGQPKEELESGCEEGDLLDRRGRGSDSSGKRC